MCNQVAAGVRHALRVDFAGNKFNVTFNRKKLIEAAADNSTDAEKPIFGPKSTV